MQTAALSTEHLTKYYGKQRGVIDLDLDVRHGEVFGFLGPNGAGKTTTIRLLLDLIRPTSGTAMIFGAAVKGNHDLRRRLGYLPGEYALYDNMTGAEFLKFMGNLRRGVDWHFVEALAERLDCRLSQPIRSLSHGNKQKLGLIQAFMHRPQLILLDEPSSGLDPLMQQEFYRMIDEVKADGGTIFISSHVLPEVERLCDRVAIIREGRLAAVETVEAIKKRALRRLEIHFALPPVGEAFAQLPGIRDLSVEGNILRCAVTGSLDALVKTAAQFTVVNLVSHEPSLEEIFLAYYNGGDNHVA